MATYPDQEFVEYVAKALVDHPDAVQVERTVDERGVLLTLTTSPEDMGNIIGRQGQAARAFRTLLRTVGAKHNARVNLKIAEPPGGRGPRMAQDQAQPAMAGAAAGASDDTLNIDELKL